MEIKILSKKREDTIHLGEFIAKSLKVGDVITLVGDLGAGKTTFVKGIGKGLKIDDDINSPTFNILKCYFAKPLNLYHIDAYRLEDVAPENKNIGLEEVIEGDGVCVIEWPMYIKEFLDFKSVLNIDIRIGTNDERNITISSDNERFKDLILSLKGFKNE
jgi:tRNA threonylcarbamoyladenosine biosynthesis protein TsaE